MIASLAGRRIDAVDADPRRFPATREELVAKRIAATLAEHGATTLVCAAACGADLLALEAAQREGIAARIVLPCALRSFAAARSPTAVKNGALRSTASSAKAQARGGVRILGLDAHDPHVYSRTNEAILDEALALAGNDPAGVVALAVWDGAIDGRTDYTANFTDAARAPRNRRESIPILEKRRRPLTAVRPLPSARRSRWHAARTPGSLAPPTMIFGNAAVVSGSANRIRQRRKFASHSWFRCFTGSGSCAAASARPACSAQKQTHDRRGP